MSISGATAVIIYNEDESKVLLSQRMGPHEPGKYAVAGGAIEMGEFPVAAAARELLEETGIQSTCLNTIPVVTSYYYSRLPFHWFCFWFSLHIKEEPITFLEKNERGDPKSGPWLWYPICDLPTPMFPETAAIITKEYHPTILTFRHVDIDAST